MSDARRLHPDDGAQRLRRAMLATALVVLSAMVAKIFIWPPDDPDSIWSTWYFFMQQDAPMLVLAAVALVLLPFAPKLPLPLFPSSGRRLLLVVLLAAAVFACGSLGRFYIFEGFDLSRDEFLAVFDAKIFSTGRLFASLPAEWRPFAEALQPQYMAPLKGGAQVVSAYLPLNAMARAEFGVVADPALLNPLLAAGAVLLLYGQARDLWPARPDAALVAVILLATSSQLLFMSMTSYAMTAHLFLNLLWLRCFLRGSAWGHGCALALGCLACGLHQFVFHPLFAAPFIARLWRPGDRRLCVSYVLAYGAMILFWGSYLRLALLWEGASALGAGAADMGASDLMARILEYLDRFEPAASLPFFLNLLRLVAWQSLLLAPLCILAWQAIRRDEGLASQLAAGIALTLLAMFVLSPFQGHGWGYRYLHGLLGSLCLLGGYGWIQVTSGAEGTRASLSVRCFAWASLFAVLIALPLHARQARALTAPSLAAEQAIASADVDVVLVDDDGVQQGHDFVRNDPFLRNRPLTLYVWFLEPGQLEALCGRYRLALFGREHRAQFGLFATNEPMAERSRILRERLGSLNCAPIMR